ncbi:hypothetical protein G7Y89_g3741 [Cudoniella acicularis]|uniref:Protein kinase domain-containing protein n=1 Tax=Cudoniella acicularis TaxID=354080 RepID=A0A8H4W5N7_9HELO|nr:hypothetical protein G7Y89_g3741 [Cudoniella acicularis]
MPIAIVRATYTEQNALETFFTELFGWGKTEVLWKRGRYQCTLPRRMTQDEIEKLQQAVRVEHYDQHNRAIVRHDRQLPSDYSLVTAVSASMKQCPAFVLNGVPIRSPTLPIEISNDGLPVIHDNNSLPLDELLRTHQVKGAYTSNGGFWSRKLLSHIISRERVLAELKTYTVLTNAEDYLDDIRPEDSRLSSTIKTYLGTFVLLLLLERGHEIDKFINEEVSDQNLPVILHSATWPGKVNLCLKTNPNQPLECFRGWKTFEKEAFERTQWQLLVPYFQLDADKNATHYTLNEKTILPWLKRDQDSRSSVQPSGQEGGFGSVSTVKIDPHSHGFRDILREVHLKDDLFALKLLHDEGYNNMESFQNEVNQLRRFNGFANPHLVTLLATFTRSGRYNFIFPYANSNLEYYWEKIKPNPKMDIDMVRWVSRQCLGIMGAIDVIHNPKHLRNLTEERYGRHGDVKPDNILWFQSSDNERGILVVSDMGLSAFHRENSKSGISRYKIPKVPGYSPPECDVKGGKISRAYDIWTLGCLFLELLTWLLGGWKLVGEFQEARRSVYITGALNNIFYTLKTIEGQEGYVAQVKTQVMQWFRQLHKNKNCPQFIHDALDIIETKMLIVIHVDRKRAKSRQLRKEFEDIHKKCLDDSDSDYCLKGIPINCLERAGSAVGIDLNEDAIAAISEHQPDLLSHDPILDGEIKKSPLPMYWENVDKIRHVDALKVSNQETTMRWCEECEKECCAIMCERCGTETILKEFST